MYALKHTFIFKCIYTLNIDILKRGSVERKQLKSTIKKNSLWIGILSLIISINWFTPSPNLTTNIKLNNLEISKQEIKDINNSDLEIYGIENKYYNDSISNILNTPEFNSQTLSYNINSTYSALLSATAPNLSSIGVNKKYGEQIFQNSSNFNLKINDDFSGLEIVPTKNNGIEINDYLPAKFNETNSLIDILGSITSLVSGFSTSWQDVYFRLLFDNKPIEKGIKLTFNKDPFSKLPEKRFLDFDSIKNNLIPNLTKPKISAASSLNYDFKDGSFSSGSDNYKFKSNGNLSNGFSGPVITKGYKNLLTLFSFVPLVNVSLEETSPLKYSIDLPKSPLFLVDEKISEKILNFIFDFKSPNLTPDNANLEKPWDITYFANSQLPSPLIFSNSFKETIKIFNALSFAMNTPNLDINIKNAIIGFKFNDWDSNLSNELTKLVNNNNLTFDKWNEIANYTNGDNSMMDVRWFTTRQSLNNLINNNPDSILISNQFNLGDNSISNFFIVMNSLFNWLNANDIIANVETKTNTNKSKIQEFNLWSSGKNQINNIYSLIEPSGNEDGSADNVSFKINNINAINNKDSYLISKPVKFKGIGDFHFDIKWKSTPNNFQLIKNNYQKENNGIALQINKQVGEIIDFNNNKFYSSDVKNDIINSINKGYAFGNNNKKSIYLKAGKNDNEANNSITEFDFLSNVKSDISSLSIQKIIDEDNGIDFNMLKDILAKENIILTFDKNGYSTNFRAKNLLTNEKGYPDFKNSGYFYIIGEIEYFFSNSDYASLRKENWNSNFWKNNGNIVPLVKYDHSGNMVIPEKDINGYFLVKVRPIFQKGYSFDNNKNKEFSYDYNPNLNRWKDNASSLKLGQSIYGLDDKKNNIPVAGGKNNPQINYYSNIYKSFYNDSKREKYWISKNNESFFINNNYDLNTFKFNSKEILYTWLFGDQGSLEKENTLSKDLFNSLKNIFEINRNIFGGDESHNNINTKLQNTIINNSVNNFDKINNELIIKLSKFNNKLNLLIENSFSGLLGLNNKPIWYDQSILDIYNNYRKTIFSLTYEIQNSINEEVISKLTVEFEKIMKQIINEIKISLGNKWDITIKDAGITEEKKDININNKISKILSLYQLFDYDLKSKGSIWNNEDKKYEIFDNINDDILLFKDWNIYQGDVLNNYLQYNSSVKFNDDLDKIIKDGINYNAILEFELPLAKMKLLTDERAKIEENIWPEYLFKINQLNSLLIQGNDDYLIEEKKNVLDDLINLLNSNNLNSIWLNELTNDFNNTNINFSFNSVELKVSEILSNKKDKADESIKYKYNINKYRKLFFNSIEEMLQDPVFKKMLELDIFRGFNLENINNDSMVESFIEKYTQIILIDNITYYTLNIDKIDLVQGNSYLNTNLKLGLDDYIKLNNLKVNGSTIGDSYLESSFEEIIKDKNKYFELQNSIRNSQNIIKIDSILLVSIVPIGCLLLISSLVLILVKRSKRKNII